MKITPVLTTMFIAFSVMVRVPVSYGDNDTLVAGDVKQVPVTVTKRAITSEKWAKAPVKEFNVEAFRYGYSPSEIVVNKGDIVKIHATSRDVPHGIFIREYNINERVVKDKTTDIEFVADKPGTFNIICSVYCGPGHAHMRGKLVVKDNGKQKVEGLR